MFRLPCNSHSTGRSNLSERSAHRNYKNNKNNNKSYTLLDQKYNSLFLNEQEQEKKKKKPRPQSSFTRKYQVKNLSSDNRREFRDSLRDEILFSPCNSKLKPFKPSQTSNNASINFKLCHDNFLIEPRKFQWAKPELHNKYLQFQIKKHERPPSLSQTKNNQSFRSVKSAVNKKAAPKIKFQLNKQQQIEPWESAQYHFDSIRLNPNNK